MTYAPTASSSRRLGDPLDDITLSPDRAFYHNVTAAHEYLLLSSRTPEEVFRMCELTEDDIRRFYHDYPDYAQKFKAAYQAAFCFGLLSHKTNLAPAYLCTTGQTAVF